MPWRLEGNTPVKFSGGEFNHCFLPSNSEFQKIKATAEVCNRAKILPQLLNIVDLEGNAPVVSELSWLMNLNDAFRWIYCIRDIFQTIVAHERRQQLARL